MKIFFLFLFCSLSFCQLRNLQSTYALKACVNKKNGDGCEFKGAGLDAVLNYGQCRVSTKGILACNTAYTPIQITDPKMNENNSNTTVYNVLLQTSNAAQLSNIVYNGFAFMNENNFCSVTFLPPLHWGDFFGFQHLRDITPNGQGHNTNFLTNVAYNVFRLLDDATISQMREQAIKHSATALNYAGQRYKLISAFQRLLNGDLPAGKHQLNIEAIKIYSSKLYAIEAPVTLDRAVLFSRILNSMNSSQIAGLLQLQNSSYIESWTKTDQKNLANREIMKGLTNTQATILTAFAGEIFSWFSGNLESDTYFGPERQFNYFGGLYLKDVLSVSVNNYSIPEQIGGTLSRNFLQILNPNQQNLFINLVSQQKDGLNSLVEVRKSISNILRKIQMGELKGSDVAAFDQLLALETRYGALDGEISALYATTYAKVYESLNSTQVSQLKTLHDLSGYPCQKISGFTYIYQWPYNSSFFESTPIIEAGSDEFFI